MLNRELGPQRRLACRKARDLALQSLQPMGAGDLRQSACLEGMQVPVDDRATLPQVGIHGGQLLSPAAG